MWQMVVEAIATAPTAVPGIDSSFWTAVTSILSLLLGQQWFRGSFEFRAVVLGLMRHMMNSVALGVVGVGLASSVLPPAGRRPGDGARDDARPGARGRHRQSVVNNIQDVDALYAATREWSWWVAHAIFGATVGLVGPALLRRDERHARLTRRAGDVRAAAGCPASGRPRRDVARTGKLVDRGARRTAAESRPARRGPRPE